MFFSNLEVLFARLKIEIYSRIEAIYVAGFSSRSHMRTSKKVRNVLHKEGKSG